MVTMVVVVVAVMVAVMVAAMVAVEAVLLKCRLRGWAKTACTAPVARGWGVDLGVDLDGDLGVDLGLDLGLELSLYLGPPGVLTALGPQARRTRHGVPQPESPPTPTFAKHCAPALTRRQRPR